MTLAEAISNYESDVITALKNWQPSQIELGNYLRKLGTSLGNRSQFSSL